MSAPPLHRYLVTTGVAGPRSEYRIDAYGFRVDSQGAWFSTSVDEDRVEDCFFSHPVTIVPVGPGPARPGNDDEELPS